MTVYRIERMLGKVPPSEIDAASYRAVACLPHFSGMDWLRSFYDADTGNMTCYYEARDSDDIRRHAEMARIPCDEVAEVVEYLPNTYR